MAHAFTHPLSEQALGFLQRVIATPSVSRNEAAVVDLIEAELKTLGLPVERVGLNLLSRIKRGTGSPKLTLCTHTDTVPANPGYTRDPYAADVDDGKLYGLGSNDAGGPLMAMVFAAKALLDRDDWSGTLELALVVEEEITGENGAGMLVKKTGMPDAAIVGEPTGLHICVAQKGKVTLQAVNRGQACHAANAYRIPHVNAALVAAQDIQKLTQLEYAERDESMGPTTINVTQIDAGVATNSIPDTCTWTIDVRVNPAQQIEAVIEDIRALVSAEITPTTPLLPAYRTDESSLIVQAAKAVKPDANCYGSDAMSDSVFYRDVPVIKCGPGMTEISHRPDEFLALRWFDDGISFYEQVALEYFKRAQGAAE